MNTTTLLRAALAAVLLFAPAPAAAQVPVPPLAARVTDLTATLTAEQRDALESRLAAFESRKGSQVAVLVVPTVQPEAIEQYATRVFDQWKLGRKGIDDGVLLVVAKNDRRLRIEVGYGLEGVIPDAIAKRIIDEAIVPRFKQGDFHGGIVAGVDRIVRLAAGESMPPPARPLAAPEPAGTSDLILYGFLAAVALVGVLQSVLGRLLGSGIAGIAAGIVVYVLAGLALALVVGILVFLFSLFVGASRGRSGWSSGGGSWSSSGSGGGFSGGGGGSGGGGASGSW